MQVKIRSVRTCACACVALQCVFSPSLVEEFGPSCLTGHGGAHHSCNGLVNNSSCKLSFGATGMYTFLRVYELRPYKSLSCVHLSATPNPLTFLPLLHSPSIFIVSLFIYGNHSHLVVLMSTFQASLYILPQIALKKIAF